MGRSAVFGIGMLAVTCGALAFRLPRLEQRPMHTDEAVHAVKFGTLLEERVYRYNPYEFHGPTLNYLTLIPAWLSGVRTLVQATEFTVRIVPVVFGVGLVLVLWLVGDGLGRPAAVCAGILTAVSHAMVFYSRYYIQETLLVFFAFATLAAVWRYTRTRGIGWAVMAGAGVGVMHATKETWVIAFAAMAGALALTLLWRRLSVPELVPPFHYTPPAVGPGGPAGPPAAAPPAGPPAAAPPAGPAAAPAKPLPLYVACIVAVAVAAAVSATLFSSFGRNLHGPLDSVLAYATYFTRAGAGRQGLHLNPWYFYLQRLIYFKDAPGPWWSEGLIVALAIVGFIAAVAGRGLGRANVSFARFLALYTLAMTAAYTVIPYKTPWCMLGFLHGMVLLAGLGAAALVRLVPTIPAKVAVCLVLSAGGCHLAYQTCRGCFKFYCDPRNPYVYAHTVYDVIRLGQRVEEIANVSPYGRDMLVMVIAPPSDYWPLPWYLRSFRRVGYWTAVPQDLDAPVIIASPEIELPVNQRLRATHTMDYFGLRPSVLLQLYVRNDLWKAFIQEKQKASGASPQAMQIEEDASNHSSQEGGPKEAATRLPARPAPPKGNAAQPAEDRGDLIAGSANWDPGVSVHRFTHPAMGSFFEVIILGQEAAYAQQAAEAAFAEIDRLEQELSKFAPGSDIWRINYAQAGKPLRVGIATMENLRVAAKVNAETRGAFDVTIGSLMDCWRNPDRSSRTPTPRELAAARARTGMNLLDIVESQHTVAVKAEGVKVDFGGIGKGYALDRMKAVLADWSIDTALVDGGRSTVLAIGRPPGRDAWMLGLSMKEIPGYTRPLPTFRIRDRAISCSAVQPNNRHVIDPRTGQPVQDKLAALSASPSGAVADALSTAFMVMSVKEVEQYCREHKDVGAMLAIQEAGEVKLIRFGNWD